MIAEKLHKNNIAINIAINLTPFRCPIFIHNYQIMR